VVPWSLVGAYLGKAIGRGLGTFTIMIANIKLESRPMQAFAKTASLAVTAVMIIAGSVSVTSMSAFGAINNCPTSNASLSRTFTGGATYTVTVPGTGTGTPISNSLSGVNATAGCTAIDLSFSNFGVVSTGTNENTLPSLAGTYMFLSPSGTTQTNPDTVTFAGLQGTGAGVNDSIDDGVDNYKVQTGMSFTSTQTYDVTDSTGPGIEAIVLTVFGVTIQTGGSGSIVVDLCQQGTGAHTPTGAVTTATACNTAVGGSGGVFQTITLNLSTAASLTAEIFPTGHSGYVDITQVINLTGGTTATNETGFLTFSNEFEETPEPSTFILMGFALAGGAAFRFRKRKQA
jgi:PEP-CTERM motif